MTALLLLLCVFTVLPQQAPKPAVPAPHRPLHDPGSCWAPPRDVSDVHAQSFTSISADALGVRHIVYTADTYGLAVYYQSSADGVDWSPAMVVPGSRDAGLLMKPDVECDGERTYVTWFGNQGLEVTWTEDRGATWAPVLAADSSAPGFLSMDLTIDRWGALHVAWAASGQNLYYIRSAATHIPGGIPGGEPRFLPAQHLALEDGRTEGNVRVGIDDEGFVSLAWIDYGYQEHTPWVRFTRAYQGFGFPPSVVLDDTQQWLQLAVAPEGPITIIYRKEVHYDFAVYTLVSTDGGQSFEGPYKQTPRDNAYLSPQQCVRVGRGGLIHAIWYEKWKPGYYTDLTYAESRDYGRTFPRRDDITDQSTDLGGPYPALAITPDEVKCMIEAANYYTQCRW